MMIHRAVPTFLVPLVAATLTAFEPQGGEALAVVPPASRAAAGGALNVLDCVGGLRDQAGGPCVRASSVPTQGLLLPYPGLSNVFSGNAVVSGGWQNTASGDRSAVVGGVGNLATGQSSAVVGGQNNVASGQYSTVGGGRLNAARGYGSTVGGGIRNEAIGSGYRAQTVAGGYLNGALASYATVGGGKSNQAAHYYATVSGGTGNDALGIASTVSGGDGNEATGAWSSVLGGRGNEAYGILATAAGTRARALHQGSFVWGDSTDPADKTSSANDEFSVYAEGGLRMFAEGDSTTTPSFVVDPDGQVGIGTASPVRPLHVRAGASGTTPNGNAAIVAEGSDDTWLNLLSDTGQVGVLFGGPTGPQDGTIVYDPSQAMIFRTGGNVNRMRITGSGDVGIGTTTPAELLDVAGDVRCVSLIQTSDARYKRDVSELTGALETVLALRGVSYEWDRERFPAGDDGRHLGFLAQEVRKVVPEAVREAEDGTLSVSYSALVPVLVEASREMEEQLRSHSALISRQEHRLGELEAVVARLQRDTDSPNPAGRVLGGGRSD